MVGSLYEYYWWKLHLQANFSSYLNVKKSILKKMVNDKPDFICLNFANPDMVGHTGNFNAAIKACETVDLCVKEIINYALKLDYVSLIISDHGNCEKMLNSDGSPNTAHTINPVPIILVDNKKTKINKGVLANIAPTILDILGIDKPNDMTMNSLL